MQAAPLSRSLRWVGYTMGTDFIYRGVINEERKRMGLSPVRHALDTRIGRGYILAAEPEICGLPADANARQAHFWHYWDETAMLDPGVESFLAKGDKPALVSLGSVERAVKNAASLLTSAAESLIRAGLRVVLISGLPVEIDRPEWFFKAAAIPHSLLLPRLRLMIHHGGVGTTYAAARYGVPQIVCPQLLDQYFWASRVAALRLGTSIPDQGSLADGSLSEDPEVHEATSGLSALLSSKNHKETVDAEIDGLLG